MKENMQEDILKALEKANKNGLTMEALRSLALRLGRNKNDLLKELNVLIADGSALWHKGRYYQPSALGLYPARIVRCSQKFCFAIRLSDEERIFVPGRFTKGALLGDMVFLQPIARLGESEEGMVVSFFGYGNAQFTGVLLEDNGRFFVQPDGLTKDRLSLKKESVHDAQPGEKIIAKVVVRGNRHSEHICELISAYGDAQTAVACSQAILDANGARLEFPEEVVGQAQTLALQGFEKERQNRVDLTHLPIFTIDSAKSKDLDDAVSVKKHADGFDVGVHIADVSHYVRQDSALDQEAFARGTSIYYANKVVPMLPEALSNGICSLNPQEERLAFSALIRLDKQGKMVDFSFVKSVIRSRVKGVYKEINAILENEATEELHEKYREVLPCIHTMYELYKILNHNKVSRGAPQLETTESEIVLDDQDRAVDIRPHITGISEGMIEEFMLLANEAAATLAKREKLPFVYRIHEQPSAEKVASLKEILERLGLPSRGVEPKMKPSVMAEILERSRGTALFQLINTQVLRSMAKARYSEDPVGHYGLALENYAHFTSPIRRYPDLMIHRILSDYLSNKDQIKQVQKRYKSLVIKAAIQSSEMENNAVKIERSCEDCYKAEYMKSHVGEAFEGVITSVLGRGMYIMLPNTVEGYVKTLSLDGEYEYDGFSKLRNPLNGHIYQVGQQVCVLCTAADVNSGNIDFTIVTPEDDGE